MSTPPPQTPSEFTKTLSSPYPSISLATTQLHTAVTSALSSTPSSTLENHWIWSGFLHVVSITPPEKQDHLVDFLLHLRKGKGEEGERRYKTENGEVGLSDLPFLGWGMRERWNFSPSSKTSKEKCEAWVNLNAFAARITSHSTPGDPLDYSMYCIWSLRDALEDSPPSNTPPNIASAQVKAASMWMMYAACEVRKRAVNGQVYERRMGRAGTRVGEEGEEWKGHSEERWRFWEKAFRKVTEGEADEETKRAVGEAVERMNKAE